MTSFTECFTKTPPDMDVKISFKITKPVEKPIQQYLIFCHGFCGNKDERGNDDENGLFQDAAEQFAEHGIVSIRYDWRGIGDSEGDFSNTTFKTHLRDLSNIIKWLKSTYNIDSRFTGLGFSLGATLFIHLNDPAIERYIFWSPVFSPKRDMWPRYNVENVIIQLNANGFYNKNGTHLGEQFISNLNEIDTKNELQNFNHNVLIIHSKNDERINYNTTEQYRKWFKIKPSICYLDEASHSFRPREKHLKTLISSTTDWLNNTPKYW